MRGVTDDAAVSLSKAAAHRLLLLRERLRLSEASRRQRRRYRSKGRSRVGHAAAPCGARTVAPAGRQAIQETNRYPRKRRSLFFVPRTGALAVFSRARGARTLKR